MAAKKPATKTTKAKKPVVRKAAPVKKSAPAKKPAVAARSKTAPANPVPAVKPAAKAAAAKVQPAAKPVKAAPPPTVEAIKPAAKPTTEPRPKDPMPLRPVSNRSLDQTDLAAGDDEGDAQDPRARSLLAGPRNVKPYIARRGEQYMNKEQLAHFRNILETWKRDLMQEVDRTVLHMKDEAANFPDPNDRATQESEFSLELRTRDRERKLIRKIDEALKRIDDGSYGYCNETGEEIGVKRLEARPVATLSIEAQERRERREKQYGDRDDRYR
ncbi:RNA polymerase-binding protein DksA [Povalibacter sp.]|uniref:RNA polymerase-binding protein DksA n=1 Tax=Povalibacter sp. TaxID=1962978 RepID=UPI002F3FC51E